MYRTFTVGSPNMANSCIPLRWHLLQIETEAGGGTAHMQVEPILNDNIYYHNLHSNLCRT